MEMSRPRVSTVWSARSLSHDTSGLFSAIDLASIPLVCAIFVALTISASTAAFAANTTTAASPASSYSNANHAESAVYFAAFSSPDDNSPEALTHIDSLTGAAQLDAATMDKRMRTGLQQRRPLALRQLTNDQALAQSLNLRCLSATPIKQLPLTRPYLKNQERFFLEDDQIITSRVHCLNEEPLHCYLIGRYYDSEISRLSQYKPALQQPLEPQVQLPTAQEQQQQSRTLPLPRLSTGDKEQAPSGLTAPPAPPATTETALTTPKAEPQVPPVQPQVSPEASTAIAIAETAQNAAQKAALSSTNATEHRLTSTRDNTTAPIEASTNAATTDSASSTTTAAHPSVSAHNEALFSASHALRSSSHEVAGGQDAFAHAAHSYQELAFLPHEQQPSFHDLLIVRSGLRFPANTAAQSLMRNYLHALVYYRRGCQLHSNTNCIMLANIKGRMGSEILLHKLSLTDKTLALEYLHSACFGGDAEACANLGVLYFNGLLSDTISAPSASAAFPTTPALSTGPSTLASEIATTATIAANAVRSTAAPHNSAAATIATEHNALQQVVPKLDEMVHIPATTLEPDYHPQQMLTAEQLLANMQRTAQRLQQEQYATPVSVDLFAMVAARLPDYERNSSLSLSQQTISPELPPYSTTAYAATTTATATAKRAVQDDNAMARALSHAMATATNTATAAGTEKAVDNSQLSLHQLATHMRGGTAPASLPHDAALSADAPLLTNVDSMAQSDFAAGDFANESAALTALGFTTKEDHSSGAALAPAAPLPQQAAPDLSLMGPAQRSVWQEESSSQELTATLPQESFTHAYIHRALQRHKAPHESTPATLRWDSSMENVLSSGTRELLHQQKVLIRPNLERTLRLLQHSCNLALITSKSFQHDSPMVGTGCYLLGRLYLSGAQAADGNKLERNMPEALHFLRHTCELGHERGCKLLQAFLFGKGSLTDNLLALPAVP